MNFLPDQIPSLALLRPATAEWVRSAFGSLTDAQVRCLPHVCAGRSVLLSAPTGAGKTLAAFLGVLNTLARRFDDGEKVDGVAALYISPLRALTYDIGKNLMLPLTELGLEGKCTVASRTGDTTQSERAKQKRKPPHILLTTPESLAILLCNPVWRIALAQVRTVIVDELHAVATNKRGTHLSLSMERLAALCESAGGNAPARIGLSATAHPLLVLAEFLCGPGRPCAIEEVGPMREQVVEVFSPLRRNPYPAAGFTGARLTEELATLIRTRKSVIVFTNTRGGTESLCIRLKMAMPELADRIEAHHSSLDRSLRFEVEDRLKRGELRAVVCSTSLELGIDIGAVDLVVMLSAPKGVSRALQRIGRSGHSIHKTSHGILVATNILDLVECMVTAKMARERQLDTVTLPEFGWDVLAQHLTGMALAEMPTPDEAFALIRKAHPFRHTTRADFNRVLHYLEGGGRSLEKQYADLFGKIAFDEMGRMIPASKRVARDYLLNVGTIAAEGMMVIRLGRRKLGSVEENFMKRLRVGDVFVLGGRTVRLVQTGVTEAKVKAADGVLPTVPRWNANKMPLASGVAEEVGCLRGELAARLENDGETAARDWLVEGYAISSANAAAVVTHFLTQAKLSKIPVPGCMLIEAVGDGDLDHLFFHTLIGRSANDALSRMVSWRASKLGLGNAMVTIDDYGFLLTLPVGAPRSLDLWRRAFNPHEAAADLELALHDSELVRGQFRSVAQTGLMAPRNMPGGERPVRHLQWSTEILFRVLQEHEPDHPLLEEAKRQSTQVFLDFPRARLFLESVDTMEWHLRELPCVSPFAFGMFASRIKEGMMHESPEEALERVFAHLSAAVPTGR